MDDTLSVKNSVRPELAVPRKTKEGAPYGSRVDGTPKGRGYFGELRTADGQIMTELSIGVDFGQGETQIPAIVPTLSPEELAWLQAGNPPTEEIVGKAVDFAVKRISQGRSPFAVKGQDY